MQIDRSNYEIWIIDWLDGNLNETEVAKLKLFLHQNPDIKEEYEEITMGSLNSSDESFPHKNNLKKTAATLPESQFEYLCIAFLENDLSPEQKSELKEITDADPHRKAIFDLFQKTRLNPSEETYRNKNRLYRRSFSRSFIRISVIGLSAAAVIIFVLLNFVLKPELLPVNPLKTAQPVPPLNKIQELPATAVQERHQKTEEKRQPVKTNRNLIAISDRLALPGNRQNSDTSFRKVSATHGADTLNPTIKKVRVSFDAELSDHSLPNNLVALKNTRVVPPFDDGNSKLGRFLARTVREKILREKTSEDSPLKGYEIAEAGVTGLNKLLGWQMALDEKKDENGELKSVYFSSRILKFNAPVKKSEALK